MKFRPLPDEASFAIRIIVALAVLLKFVVSYQLLISSFSSIGTMTWVALIVFIVGSLLILAGFLTRWAALVTIVYYVGTTGYSLVASGGVGSMEAFLSVIGLLSVIAPYLAIFLLGPGSYSVDARLQKRRAV
jgi:uncharacterized membrane protein YphA (DoxX/SURF4 family)